MPSSGVPDLVEDDDELVDLFEELAGNDRELADRLKPLLAARLH